MLSRIWLKLSRGLYVLLKGILNRTPVVYQQT